MLKRIIIRKSTFSHDCTIMHAKHNELINGMIDTLFFNRLRRLVA